jgi:hypothetical protein
MNDHDTTQPMGAPVNLDNGSAAKPDYKARAAKAAETKRRNAEAAEKGRIARARRLDQEKRFAPVMQLIERRDAEYTANPLQARRQRSRLHPDKLGRAQTALEAAEYQWILSLPLPPDREMSEFVQRLTGAPPQVRSATRRAYWQAWVADLEAMPAADCSEALARIAAEVVTPPPVTPPPVTPPPVTPRAKVDVTPRAKVDVTPRLCPGCHTTFTPRRWQATTCGPRCRQRLHRSRQR